LANNSEISRLLAVKAALVATRATTGFQFIRQIAKNLEAKAIEEAIEEKDRALREEKVLVAHARKMAYADLWKAVEAGANIDPEADLDSGFGEIENFEGEG
jgi:hypothetical protein